MRIKTRQTQIYLNLCRLLPTALFISLTLGVVAQKSTKPQFYASAGFLAGNVSTRDGYFSAIPFTGPAYGAVATVGMSQRRSSHEISFRFISSHTEAETMEGQTMDQFYFKGSYTFLYLVTDPAKSFKFSAGAGADFQDANRAYNKFINNHLSYEFIASANIAALVSYDIQKGPNKLIISDQVHIPFLSALKQPLLGGTDGQWQTGSWALVQYVSNELKIEKGFGGHHQVGLGYLLNYYAFQTDREVTEVQQLIEVKYAYHF